MIFCDPWSSTCGLYAAELLLYAIQIISSHLSLTRIRQGSREALDNGFLAEDVSGRLRYPVQLIVKATSGVC